MKQIQPSQGGGGGGSMFSKYSGEQINQIPEGYVQAMGQSPIAALIHSGLQGYQMGQQMQMAQTKMGLEERQVASGEKSAAAAAAKATSDEGKLALLTEDKAIQGQAAIDKTELESRKFELEALTNAHKGYRDEGDSLKEQLKTLMESEPYKKNDKKAKDRESAILARQVSIGEKMSEFNDRIAEATKPKETTRYQLPSSISLTPNDPVRKKMEKSVADYDSSVALYNRAPGVALVPKSPVQAANDFKGQLTAEELKRLSRFHSPLGN